ncbi:hypothetical protein ACJX0J_015255, partial [Zea mays]
TLLTTHIGKSQVGVFWNCDGFIALSETGKNVFSDTNSSEKNNDNFNSRWPFLFNAYGGDTAIERWQQYLRGWAKTRKEILQKLDTLDKKAETCLLSTQEDGLKKHITSYYKSLFGPADESNDIPQITEEENTSLTADFTIDETAMNRLPTQTAGVKNGVIGLGGFKKIGLSEDGMWQQILRKKYLGNKTFGQVLMVCSKFWEDNLHQNGKFSSQKWNGSKKCISLAIDLLYLWIWDLLGCRGSIKTQRQRYIRNDVMLAGAPCGSALESLQDLLMRRDHRSIWILIFQRIL